MGARLAEQAGLSRKARLAGLVLAFLLMLNDIAQSEYDQANFDGLNYSSYYFLVYFTTSFTVLVFPAAVAAEFAWRRATGRSASWRDYAEGRLRPRLAANPGFAWRRYWLAAVPLAAVNVASTYCWYMSLDLTPVSVNSPLSRASTLTMVFAFSVAFLGERVTPAKALAVTLCLLGVSLTGYGHYLDRDSHESGGGTVRGYGLILAAAVLWAVYEVAYRRRIGAANAHGVMLVVSMQGAVVLALMWPLLPAAVATGLEPWPALSDSRVSGFLLANTAFVVWYYFFYAMAMSTTTALFVTVVGLLGIPVSAVADWLLHDTTFGAVTLCGMVVVAAGVLALNWPQREDPPDVADADADGPDDAGGKYVPLLAPSEPNSSERCWSAQS